MIPESVIWQTFPILRTDRLVLRQIVAADLDKVFEGLSDPRVIKHYGVSFSSRVATEEQMDWYEGLWNNRTGIWWAICLEEQGDLIGACGFNDYAEEHQKSEIGYWLIPKFWQKGFASEALKAMLEFGFERLHLQRIEAYVDDGNDGSTQLLEKLNFIHEGTMRNCEFKNGQFLSLRIYAMLQRDYLCVH